MNRTSRASPKTYRWNQAVLVLAGSRSTIVFEVRAGVEFEKPEEFHFCTESEPSDFFGVVVEVLSGGFTVDVSVLPLEASVDRDFLNVGVLLIFIENTWFVLEP